MVGENVVESGEWWVQAERVKTEVNESIENDKGSETIEGHEICD